MKNQVSETALCGLAHVPGHEMVRNLDAAPIQVNYAPRIDRVTCEVHGDDFVFSTMPDPAWRESNHSAPVRLDAWAVRTAFESVKTQTDALAFLNAAGDFWRLGRITWNHFLEWQEFVRLVQDRDLPKLASAGSRAMQAIYAMTGFQNSFFTKIDPFDGEEIEAHKSHLTGQNLKEFDRTISDSTQWHEQQIRELQKGFFRPSAALLTVEWVVPPESIEKVNKDPALQNKIGWLPEYHKDELGLKPVLLLTPQNILEAIASTICADRWHGIERAKCLHCGKLFDKRSARGQKYCPSTRGAGTNSRCKNAGTQKDRRDRMREDANGVSQPANPTKSKRTKKGGKA